LLFDYCFFRLFFFFVLPQLLPRSTLFPYTTLFRSSQIPAGRDLAGEGADRVRGPSMVHHMASIDPHMRGIDHLMPSLDLLAKVGDRKSTRLNSRRSQISYAVFCLKKKKI